MSRNNRNNNVRGPTSALTEFLKQSGITATTIARRAATQNQPTAGPSNLRTVTNGEEEEEQADEQGNEEIPSPRRTRARRTTNPSGYASDELDEPPEPAPKKRKLTKAAETRLKAKEKAKKKKGKKDDEDYSDDEDEDAYTALSKSMWTNVSKPSVGSFSDCAECEKKFTVTKYTMAANPGPGFLCHKCAKASGADPFKKPAVSKKRKAPADKRTVVNFEERQFPSLVSLCIQLISNHIDDVEALGDIGAINKEALSKAISKSRSLTSETAPLFYSTENTSLTLYDATNLSAPAFVTLAYLNPSLTTLRLDLCGRMDDTVMDVWATSLPSLTRLELLGPFLIRVSAWQKFFQSHPKLESFLITQSPRFDLDCVKSLVDNCKGLKDLRLKEIGKMDDAFLVQLKKLKKGPLRYLDLSDPVPTNSFSDAGVVGLLKIVGPTLIHLDLSKHIYLTDAFLKDGVRPYVSTLQTLNLSGLPELTDEGVAEFFNGWSEGAAPKVTPATRGGRKKQTRTQTQTQNGNLPLTSLDLSRNASLSSLSLEAIMQHSGSTLQTLNINAWKDTPQDALNLIAEAKELTNLDIGWCREVDDFVVKGILDGCEKILEVKVWGCNRVTDNCPRKRGVSIYGVESHSAV